MAREILQSGGSKRVEMVRNALSSARSTITDLLPRPTTPTSKTERNIRFPHWELSKGIATVAAVVLLEGRRSEISDLHKENVRRMRRLGEVSGLSSAEINEKVRKMDLEAQTVIDEARRAETGEDGLPILDITMDHEI